VQLRVAQGGHDVPPDVIERRFYRALDLLFDAAGICHQAFFFDNSKDNTGNTESKTLVAHLFRKGGKQVLEKEVRRLPKWVKTYYMDKQQKKPSKK
jgi:predicted ABC-type ATPase